MGSHKRKVVSDSIFIALGTLILKLKSLIFIPFIIKGVGLANYGVYVQIIVTKELINPFIDLSMGNGFNRYTSQYADDDIANLRADYWSVIWVTLGLSLFGAFSMYSIAPWLSKKILAGASLDSIKFASLFIITGALWDQTSKYIGARKYLKLYSIGETVSGFLPPLVFTIGVYLKKSLLYGLIGYVIAEGILNLIAIGWISSKIGIGMPEWNRAKKFINYSWALIFSDISGGILSKVDRYFIGYFNGPSAIGIYNIVYSACGLLDSFSIPFVKYFAVYLPKDWDEGRYDKVVRHLREGLLYYLVVSMSGLVLLAYLLNPAIKIILGKDVNSFANAEGLIIITGLGLLGLGSSRFFYQMLKYQEKNFMQLFFQIGSAVVNILLNIWLVKKFGILGAGIATFISYLLILVLSNYYLKIGLDRTFIYKVSGLVVSSVLMSLWLGYWHVQTYFDLIFSFIVASGIYSLAVFALKILDLKEIKSRFLSP